MKRITLATLFLGLAAVPAAGQSDLASACSTVPDEARATCLAVAQTAQSAQPQIGILIEGGNPVLGTASTSGLRLGILPRVSGSVRVNGVVGRIPNVLSGASNVDRKKTIALPALGANASVGVFSGVSVLPTVGGIGSVDLLGSATWIPLHALGSDDFAPGSDDFAWGVGARIGLLRESFTMPGVSVSVMRHHLGTVSLGEVCRGGEVPTTGNQSLCPESGDPGEVAFNLTGWSGRAAISKRLLGLGLTAGVGYDRFSSDLDFALRDPRTEPCAAAAGCSAVFRFQDRKVKNRRWSGFVDASYTMLVATLSAEAGWMRGGGAVPGFNDTNSDFDPGSGTFFGSLGVRVSL
jgi:hypothetical protein